MAKKLIDSPEWISFSMENWLKRRQKNNEHISSNVIKNDDTEKQSIFEKMLSDLEIGELRILSLRYKSRKTNKEIAQILSMKEKDVEAVFEKSKKLSEKYESEISGRTKNKTK